MMTTIRLKVEPIYEKAFEDCLENVPENAIFSEVFACGETRDYVILMKSDSDDCSAEFLEEFKSKRYVNVYQFAELVLVHLRRVIITSENVHTESMYDLNLRFRPLIQDWLFREYYVNPEIKRLQPDVTLIMRENESLEDAKRRPEYKRSVEACARINELNEKEPYTLVSVSRLIGFVRNEHLTFEGFVVNYKSWLNGEDVQMMFKSNDINGYRLLSRQFPENKAFDTECSSEVTNSDEAWESFEERITEITSNGTRYV